MSTSIPINLQIVNGDPKTTGGNINITTGTVTASIANEAGEVLLSSVESGDTITISGVSYSYEYLGSHLVRGDPDQPAAYIRIIDPIPAGGTLSVGDTFAIDLTGEPGDPDYPNLQNGNTQGDVTSLDVLDPIQFPGFICFARGTLIDTGVGPQAIEHLRVGCNVFTMDNGYQPIRWIGSLQLDTNDFQGNPKLRPIRIHAGALGSNTPTQDLRVSPQHRIFVNSVIAERMFGTMEILVPAVKLLSLNGVDVDTEANAVTYYHILFDRHEIIFSNGAPTESLFTGKEALKSIGVEGRREILTLFPELYEAGSLGIKPARYIPSGKRQKQLVERHAKNEKPLLR